MAILTSFLGRRKTKIYYIIVHHTCYVVYSTVFQHKNKIQLIQIMVDF